MAIHAFLPLFVVLAGVNGKISIMRLKPCGPPARLCGMTGGTILRQSGCAVVGVAGSIKSRLVTADAGCRNIGKKL